MHVKSIVALALLLALALLVGCGVTRTPAPTPTPKPPGEVWIPFAGTMYHSHARCSNMSDPAFVSLAEALRLGYNKCSKCW